MDPIRDEIPNATRQCKTAGINIRMVTGDNIDTAKAISVKAGIITEDEMEEEFVCMDGKTFREECGGLKQMEDPEDRGFIREEIGNKQQFRKIAAKLKVLARSTPEDKYMLVRGLQELGKIVAVTGDGTNDAPALKKADVGFSMGITGTEVAKEASDIILLDDNFQSIITAVKWGRNIFTNVRKFLQFQLTVNVVAMFIVFFGGAVNGVPPLTAVQMLWVNLIMDTFAALALATEPPSDSLLLQKPYNKSDSILTSVMFRNVIGHSIFQIAILIVFVFWGVKLLGLEGQSYNGYSCDDESIDFYEYPDGVKTPTCKTYQYTFVFNAFVFMQVFNEINARKLGDREFNVFAGFFNNWIFLFIILITIATQIAMVQYGGAALRTVPLTAEEHGMCIGIGAVILVWGKFITSNIFRIHHQNNPSILTLREIPGERERND